MLDLVKKAVPVPFRKFVRRHLLWQPDVRDDSIMSPEEREEIRRTIQREIAEHIQAFDPAVKATSTNGQGPCEAGEAAIYSDYFKTYRALAESGHTPELEKLKEEQPLCAHMCQQFLSYFQLSHQLEGPIGHAMQRLCYRFLPLFNQPQNGSGGTELPLVGLLSHGNTQPREFLLDALDGLARVEDVTSETVISLAWGDRPYAYLEAIKQEVQKLLDEVPDERLRIFPSRRWLVEQVSYQVQSEIALGKLVRAGRWKMLIVGDSTGPLSLALFDMPAELRPPIVHFNHGCVSGYPVVSMFLKADWALVRGPRDYNLYRDLGFPADRIISVGSPGQESFATQAAIEQRRKQTRLELGLDDAASVFIYATTWDPGLYKAAPPAAIQQLVIDGLKLLVQRRELTNPILLLKYHPHRASGSSYTTSRLQYPLENFLQLSDSGLSVRLIKDLGACLPAADCFIAHESSVLCDAVGAAVPTVSLELSAGNGRPTLDFATYSDLSAHRLLSVSDTPDVLSDTMAQLLDHPRGVIYEQCKRAWSNSFACGRTEGLARFAQLARTILAGGVSPLLDNARAANCAPTGV